MSPSGCAIDGEWPRRHLAAGDRLARRTARRGASGPELPRRTPLAPALRPRRLGLAEVHAAVLGLASSQPVKVVAVEAVLDRDADGGGDGTALAFGLALQLVGERDGHPALDDGAGALCRRHLGLSSRSRPCPEVAMPSRGVTRRCRLV